MASTTNDIITDVQNTASGAAAGDIGAYISLAIYIIMGVAIIGGILFGLGRGFGKTVIRLVTVVISLIAAYIIASSLSGWIATFFEGKTLNDTIFAFSSWVGSFVPGFAVNIPEEIQNILNYFDPQTAQNLVSLVLCLFISPVIFVAVFYVLKTASMLIYWLLTLMCGMIGKKSLLSVLGGGLVGAIQGVVISLVLLIPIAGFSQLAAEARVAVQESDAPEYTKVQVEEVYATYLDSTLNNPILHTLNAFGADAMFAGLTTATINDYTADMGEEAKEMFLIYVNGISLADIDIYNPTPWREHLIRVTEAIGQQRFTATTVSGILRSLANALEGGAIVIPAEDPYKSLLYDMFKTLQTSNKDNIEGDLKTLVNIYLIMGEHDLIREMIEGTSDGLIDKMLIKTDSGEIVIDLIIDELGKNPRTTLLLDSFAKLSVAALSNSVNLGEDATELYNNVKDGVNDVLKTNKEDYETEEEYKEALGENLDNTLKENGITLDEEIISEMTNYIAENYSDKEEITDRDVADAILYYYSAYMESQPVAP